MHPSTRREFFADVGRGMLVAGVGATLATEMGLVSRAFADPDGPRLLFGDMEPLVGLMQDTPANKLIPALVEKIKAGADLRTLTAAGALANARTFGGQDYVGFHTFMALAPALEMSKELSDERKALPVLKVLHRNARRIQEYGGKSKELLHPVEAAELPAGHPAGEVLRDATRKQDFNGAERTFAAIAKDTPGEAFNHMLWAVEDEVDVHRIVLAWRAWVMLDIAGKEHAHTLLRQSVRYCVNMERPNRINAEVRTILPKLLDQHKLLEKPFGTRKADDAWIDQMSQLVCNSNGAKAAEAAAAALAEGFAPDQIAEAISLGANLLVLRDGGRSQDDGAKLKGSVHGDSVGVHASDSANAWRNIARVSNQRNTAASIILGAYHTAGQSGHVNKERFPSADQLERIRTTEAGKLLEEADDAVKHGDQARAMAIVHKYGELGHPARPIFDMLIKYGVSEDGALHAEKYYRTVCEEFANSRPTFKWRHLVALARVTASEFGITAPGYAEACKLLKV